MPEEVPALSGRLRVAAGAGVVLVVSAGLVLRFWTRSALWLDEALTVDIARLPLHEIPNALKHDGAPPLYYVLLHFWIVLFGQSNDAVRSLSGLIGVATLPVAWLCGRRFGGHAVAWTTLVLLASAPFAVYYATESRMYALVILLTGCGFLALQRAITAPRLGNMAAVAIVAAALLYTQYWSLYLIAVTAIWLGISILRSYHRGRPQDAPWRALIALGVGCLLFLPWVPTFLYQSKYTGTPWAAPPNFSAVINAVTGFTDNQGSTQATGTNQGRLLAIIYFTMLALALFGVGKSDRLIELDLHTRPRSRGVTFVVVGTLFAAIAGGILSTSAFSSRYAAVVFLPLILLVALGTTSLLSPKVRLVVVTAAVAAGLFSSVQNITTQRTQATEVAKAINAEAKPGDVIGFCPDQLGPAVSRQIHDPSQYKMITFPRETGPAIVNWVNYGKVVAKATPKHFSDVLLSKTAAGNHIWMVWQPLYQTYGIKCEQIAAELLTTATARGGGGRNVVTTQPQNFYEPMNLTEFTPSMPSS
jgi:mannosyltransferase